MIQFKTVLSHYALINFFPFTVFRFLCVVLPGLIIYLLPPLKVTVDAFKFKHVAGLVNKVAGRS